MHRQAKERPKIVVLDANFSWTRNLFTSLAEVADVLLLYPKDFRSFKKIHNRYFIDWTPVPVSPGVWQQRICLPPGWLFTYWTLSEVFLSNLIKRFSKTQIPVVAFTYPYYGSLPKRLKAPSIYYVMDEYKHYWLGREHLTHVLENKAVMQADLTVCTALYRARYLQNIIPSAIDKIVHIPHGTSDAFIAKGIQSPRRFPGEIPYTPPLVGYIGALNYRFDFHFLYDVAIQLPDVSFVLGGKLPDQNDGDQTWFNGFTKAKQLSNVHFLGYISNDSIDAYIYSFDALILPYSQCAFNRNACPMKLWDYMGTSIPIVANDAVPEVSLWAHVIHIAPDASSFSQKIRLALTDRQWQAQERIQIAKQNTWRLQADKLMAAFEQRMQTNKP